MKRMVLALLCAFAAASASAAEPPRERGPILSGTVTDPEGRPVAARLWAVTDRRLRSGIEEAPPHDIETAADGSFAVSGLPRGQAVTLFSCAAGFLPAQVRVDHPDEPVRMTLQPAAAIQGRVLGPDGSPLAGAEVWAGRLGVEPSCFSSWHPCPVTPSAATNAEGRFEVAPLYPGWHNLFANAPGLVGGSAERVRAGAGESVSGISIHLRTGVAVTGRVVDPEGAPLAGIQIRAYNGRGIPEAVTAADGSYRLEGVDQGEIQIAAEIEGGQQAERRIRVGQEGARVPDLILDRPEPASAQGDASPLLQPAAHGFTITGRLLGLSEEEIAAARLPMAGATLDAEGVYRVTVQRPGRVLVVALSGSRSAVRAVEPVPGQDEVVADLVFPPVREVTGRVVDAEGGPVAGARLRVLHSREHQSTSTRSDGTFVLRLVDGTFGLEAKKPGYATGRLASPFRVMGCAVEDLEIRLERSATIRGRILGLAPGEVPVVRAHARDLSQPGEVDLDGGFTIPDLDPGSWQIVAYLHSGPEADREVRHVLTVLPGVFEIEIDLDFTGTEGDGR
jgi:hypothetical protein